MVLKYKGINISYNIEGQGKPIVLLHGFLESKTMWQYTSQVLKTKHQVITIDLPGHGKTGCLGYIHTMETMADATLAVLGHHNIKEASFIGHSMGGYVSLAVLENTPNLVSSLCLMNSTASEDSLERKINRDRAIEAVKQNHKAFISMAIANLFSPDNRYRLENKINNIKKEALNMPLQGIVAALEGMKIRKDRVDLFAKSSINKLIIAGQKDPVIDYKLLLEQAKSTNSKFIEFPDGHMSHIENESEFLQSIMHFIEN
ncbi:alpha/beta fold hydrolase [Mangrovimonas aestuarii]|uniref:alpha/beta fold hydrolase n=1 Tax=Mangrovimonas aestuarii TaxID=3018443 RepID=UPI00237A0789|nr:alpha/beta hydrolase [Mangrovimonas aestuarii]